MPLLRRKQTTVRRVAAKHLKGMPRIRVASKEAMIHMHLAFDCHEIILTTGVWSACSDWQYPHPLHGDTAQSPELMELYRHWVA